MQKIVGQIKCTTTNHTKGDNGIYMVGLELFIMSSFQRIKTIPLNKFYFKLDELKAAKSVKMKSVKRGHNILSGLHSTGFFGNTRKKLLHLSWKILIHIPYSADICTF